MRAGEEEGRAEEARCFIPCTLGLEGVVAREVRDLGASGVEAGRGGVHFMATRRVAYAANLWLRAGIRVQHLIAHARLRGPDDLYRWILRMDWSRYMTPGMTIAVDASVSGSEHLRHSKYAAYRVKDAICDHWREKVGRRPSVNPKQPDLPLKLVIKGNEATLYRNLSGTSLHKRGWRPIQVKAPLNEALAAGLVLLSDWDRKSPLLDPMCGSGTIVIEAAMIAADRAPGLGRRFAFERWPDFDRELWSELRREARRRGRPSLPFRIEGADRHGGAVSLARRGAMAADVRELVRFSTAPLDRFRPDRTPSTVVTNPPYGRRIGREEDLNASWRDLGLFLREHCRGAHAWVLCGDRTLTRHLGLKASVKHPVMNGPIECRFIRYDISAAGDSDES